MQEHDHIQKQQDLEHNEELKVFIRREVETELRRILEEERKTRGWQEVKRPGPQEHK